MNILVVHAHPEPRSFSSALADTARETLLAAGHTVTVSDLYAQGFDPVSDRRNFTTAADPAYYKQQAEEAFATEHNGFSAEVEGEIRKLEAADALIFSFPLWWFGMPAILKGWVDRVFACGRVYGGPKLYENGIGGGKKPALILLTTGGGATSYGGRGVNPPLAEVLTAIQHGIFWFNGFQPLPPFVAWSPARVDAAARTRVLEELRVRLKGLFTEPRLELPPLADFPEWGPDKRRRFMVTISRPDHPDLAFVERIPAERERFEELRRRGILLEYRFTPKEAQPWRGFVLLRAADRAEAAGILQTLPLAAWLRFEIHEIL